MKFQDVWNIIKNKLPKKIQGHKGLNYFVKHRAKFEGWLKVELCEILSRVAKDIVPEKDRIDIVFDDWLLELKTVNTNYKYQNTDNKTRPITKNINGILNDIEKLKKYTDGSKRTAVLFIVFPLSLSKHGEDWKKHLSKIEKSVKLLEQKEFKFNNDLQAVLYCGLVIKDV